MLGWAGEPYGLGPGDRVVITQMEHHSNIVPWQLTTQRTGAELAWLKLTDDGRLDLSNLDEVINEQTKVVSVVHVSNILGTVNPLDVIVRRAHDVGAIVVVDASQSAPHIPLDVQELGADFVAFTGHKMLGPTGIGVLWGRAELLNELPPFLGGGEMVGTVTMESSTYAPIPHKYEAGTMPIAEAVGLGAAVDYLNALGMENVAAHEHEIVELRARAAPGGRGPADHRPADRGRARRRDLLHAGRGGSRRDPPARRRPGARRAGHRRARRPALRAAGLRALWNSRDHASVFLCVHDEGGDRRARRGA